MSALDYLPEFLLGATFVTGLIWAWDRARWRPARLAAVAELDAGTPAAQQGQPAFQDARDALLREPPLMEWAGGFFPVLAVVLVLRSFLYEPFVIPSSSMVPTLEVGDFILVNKYTYGLRLPVFGTKVMDVGLPARGDVMVFYPPGIDSYYIKRVVGLPGDEIVYRNKQIFVNGEAVPQDIIDAGPDLVAFEEQLGDALHRSHLWPGRATVNGRWDVPQGHYFMMGDNRDNSADSRVWRDERRRPTPFVPEANIVGRAVAVWMHKEPGFALPSFARSGGIE